MALDLEGQTAMPEVRLANEVDIHYEEYNRDGDRTVLLLHGLGSAGIDWLLQFKLLAEAGFRIIAPDLRGFGRSSWPGHTSVAEMATDVAFLLDTLDVRWAHVVGISMGGTVALQFALDHAERVGRLVLVNTFARLRPQGLGPLLYFALRVGVIYTLGLERQAYVVSRRLLPRPEHALYRFQLRQRIAATDPRAYRAAMWALLRFNVERRLGEIQVPTLVVTGEADSTVPSAVQRRLAEGIPTADQVRLPESGHAVIVESPAAFNRVLCDFLASS
jgi:3-oxoadipate enol-lactonase